MAPLTARQRRLAALLLAIAASVYLLRTRDDARATLRTPSQDDEVIERLPYSATEPKSRELFMLRARLAANPNDLALATLLARRHIQESRARSDPRYLGYAEAALAPWWSAASPPLEVLVLRATIRQSTHDFEGALRDLDLALEQSRI